MITAPLVMKQRLNSEFDTGSHNIFFGIWKTIFVQHCVIVIFIIFNLLIFQSQSVWR